MRRYHFSNDDREREIRGQDAPSRIQAGLFRILLETLVLFEARPTAELLQLGHRARKILDGLLIQAEQARFPHAKIGPRDNAYLALGDVTEWPRRQNCGPGSDASSVRNTGSGISRMVMACR